MENLCIDAIMRRKSIRRYLPDPVPDEDLRILLEAARRAPTDAALHLWSAVYTRDAEKKARIAVELGQPHIGEASVFFVFIADLYRLKRILEYRGEELGDNHFALLLFSAIDAGLAAENLAIAATSMGYGTCFIGAVQNNPELIIQEFNLPKLTYPLFGLTLGVPAEEPPLRPRLPLNMLFHSEAYHKYSEEDLEEAYRVMAPITRRRDYLRILKRYAAREGYFETRNKTIPRLLEEMGFRLPK